jgi:hypothetical protein
MVALMRMDNNVSGSTNVQRGFERLKILKPVPTAVFKISLSMTQEFSSFREHHFRSFLVQPALRTETCLRVGCLRWVACAE